MFGLGQFPDTDARLKAVVEMMREVSLQTDPDALVRVYGRRMAQFLASDGFVSLSRRNLTDGQFRITRSSRWTENIDPWRQTGKLPLLRGGVFADLLYADEPALLRPFHLPPDDPVRPHLALEPDGLVFIPHYDMGKSINGVFHLFKKGNAFDPDNLPEMVWMSNLFGRGVNNLALSRELKGALDQLDRELKVVEQMQQALLPGNVPEIPTLKLAAHYQTSRHAGGDYYDFFPLAPGKWGLFVADVSGHGTPAAVVMAITHALAHNYPGQPDPPALMLHYLNQKLCASPTSLTGNFVTAFYGIYDADARTLTYSSAGHPEVRLLRAGTASVESLSAAKALPLGIADDERFRQETVSLRRGDRFVLYTDGFTESFNPQGDMFGTPRLDNAICLASPDPQSIVNTVVDAVGQFTGHPRGDDDRTLIAAVVM